MNFSCEVLRGEKEEAMDLKMCIKDIFIQCLNDIEIQEMIKEKINSDNVKVLTDERKKDIYEVSKEENNRVTTEVAKKIDEILNIQKNIEKTLNLECNEENATKHIEKTKYKKNIEELKTEYEKKIKEYQDMKVDLQKEISEQRERIAELVSVNQTKDDMIHNLKCKYSFCDEISLIWSSIKDLSEENQQYIYELAGGENLLSVISLGRDDGKIEQLWCFFRDILIKENTEKYEINILNGYFDFCIKVYNSSREEIEKYAIYEIQVDDDFDTEKAVRTTSSKQIGRIKEVLVKGYKYKNNIKYKPIVIVE